MNRV
jgi:hypothetical protein